MLGIINIDRAESLSLAGALPADQQVVFFLLRLLQQLSNNEHAAFWGTGTSIIGGQWAKYGVTSWCQMWPDGARCDQLLPGVTNCCHGRPTGFRCDQVVKVLTSWCQMWPDGARCAQLFRGVSSYWRVWPAVTRWDQLLSCVTSCCQVGLAVARCDQLLPGVTNCCKLFVTLYTFWTYFLEMNNDRILL